MSFNKCALLLAAVLGLSACQGQNPFKRSSNPVKNYPKVASSIEKGDGAVPFGTPSPSEDNSRFACHSPFAISSNSPDGKTVFSFSEGSNLAYEIQIVNKLGDEFQASVANLPKDADFKLIRQLSKNSAAYQLSWSPKSATAVRSTAVLTLSSKQMSERCKANATETLNLIVEKTKDRPNIEISDLPQTDIKFGKEVKFSIEVSDSQATAQKTPSVSISFDAVDATVESEQLINGKDAVDCDKNPKQRSGKWVFTCSFNSAALQKVDEEKLVGSGKTAVATFLAQAESRASGKQSNATKGRVKVQFEKVNAPAPAPQVNNAPAAPAPAQPQQSAEQVPLPKPRPAGAPARVTQTANAAPVPAPPRSSNRPTSTTIPDDDDDIPFGESGFR